MRMATKQRCKHRMNFLIHVSLLYLRRFAMRVKHVLKLLNQTTTLARKVKCGCDNIQSTPNSHMAATDLHAQPYGNCHQKIYFKYVFTAIASLISMNLRHFPISSNLRDDIIIHRCTIFTGRKNTFGLAGSLLIKLLLHFIV